MWTTLVGDQSVPHNKCQARARFHTNSLEKEQEMQTNISRVPTYMLSKPARSEISCGIVLGTLRSQHSSTAVALAASTIKSSKQFAPTDATADMSTTATVALDK
jgi:hypothetical protein